jgi:hypothetical protein
VRSSGRTKRKRAVRFKFGDFRNDALELKMKISHAAASRSRSVESRAFFPKRVSHVTDDEATPRSPYAWVFALRKRALSGETGLGSSAKFVLITLLEHVDADGRTWVGIETLAAATSFGSLQTVRKALKELAEAGWLRIVSQTWASLTTEQAAAGRKTPRRGDVGQAPNLYVILDGHGNPACRLAGPGLVRSAPSSSSLENSAENPPQNSEGGPLKIQEGGPLSNLIGDQDPSEDLSMKGSAERAPRVEADTHISSKNSKKAEEPSEAWKDLVETHTGKTKSVYGLPPLPPDLRRTDKQALAESLDGAAAEVRAKFRQRTGVERDFAEVRRELAERVMTLYFKRDNEHLRRVKHALRDLPREFHARLTEAVQALLRESHDVAPPRRAPLEQPPEPVASVDKPVETSQKKQVEEPKKQLESVDKPRKDASMSTALEARRLLEALNASPQQELFRPSRTSAEKPERELVEPERARASADKPSQDEPKRRQLENQPSPESFEDKASPRFERPLGRTGAPRWGSIGPRPTKVRSVIKTTLDDAEPDEEHGGGSTSPR